MSQVWENVEVCCRAEIRAEQVPQRFLYNNQWWVIDEIMRENLCQGTRPGEPVYRVFLVCAKNTTFQLRMDDKNWLWQARIVGSEK